MRIGHAAKDENKRYSGGQAGDQTKVEVYITEWYKRPWNVILRCVDPEMREKIALNMEYICKNDNIGYDQGQRNTLLSKARPYGYDASKIKEPCECDCSSAVSVCCMYAGVDEKVLFKGNNCATTSVLRSRLCNTQMFKSLYDEKYVGTPVNLLRGDILLYEGHHVAVALDNGINTNLNQSIHKVTGCSKLNVREGAGTNYKVLTVLNAGDQVEILESTDGWHKIKSSKGIVGWCSAKYIS